MSVSAPPVKKRKTEKCTSTNIFKRNGIHTLNLKDGFGYKYERLPINESMYCNRMSSSCQKIKNATFTYDETGYKLSYTHEAMHDLEERHSKWESAVFSDSLMGCTPIWKVIETEPLTLKRTVLKSSARKLDCKPSYMEHFITFDVDFNLNSYCNDAFGILPGTVNHIECKSTCLRCISTWPYVKCQFHRHCDMTQLNDLHKCYECERVTCQDHRVSWAGGDDGTMLCYQCFQRFLNGREGKNLNVAQFCWLGKPDHTGIYAEHIKYFDSDSDSDSD